MLGWTIEIGAIMSDVAHSTIREVSLGGSRWQVAGSDPKWLRRYLTLVVLDVLILAFMLIVGLTDWFAPTTQLSYFLLAPAFALLGVYSGMSPGYFIARQGIAAIERTAPELQVWSLSPLPLNVDTIRKWAPHTTPRASVRRPTFIGFGPESMSIWIKDGMSISEVLLVPRKSMSLVRIIQNGTRPVINLGATVEQSNQMALIATKGGFPLSPSSLMNGAQFIESWVRRSSNQERSE